MRRQFALLDDFLFPLQLPSETFHVDMRRCFLAAPGYVGLVSVECQVNFKQTVWGQ